MKIRLTGRSIAFCAALALAACGGSSSSNVPPQAGSALVRYADGAPLLEALINGIPQPIGNAYLQVDNKTVVSAFNYGTITSYFNVTAGTLSLTARNPTFGYAVGPLKSPSLSAGKQYTLIVVGSYPTYRVLAFEDPAANGSAQLSLYEAAPSTQQAGFGTFQASTSSNFKQLGDAAYGSIGTATLGKSVSDIGGFVGSPNHPLGALTLAQVDSFDTNNALPFENASRLSLFLFDPKSSSAAGPVFASLDR